MDSQQQLEQYITESLAHGHSKEAIKSALRAVGWPADVVSQAFREEQSTPVPPPPTPQAFLADAKLHRHAAALHAPLVRALVIAGIVGVVSAVVFKITLPSAEDQAIYSLSGSLSGSIVPPGVLQVLFTILVLCSLVALVQQFVLKLKHPYDIIMVGWAAAFLALILQQSQIIDTGFVLWLLVAFPFAQLVAQYARTVKVFRIAYVAATAVLLVLSMRVLNLGHL